MKSNQEEYKGKQSIESLSHFSCGKCEKWWSIGDAPKRNNWFCPWCGEENSFIIEDKSDIKK